MAIRPRFSVNTADAVIGGAVAGLGCARVMTYQAAQAVADGALTPLLQSFAPPPNPVHLVHAAQALQPLKQRAFLDFVAPRMTEVLDTVAQRMATCA